MPVLGDHHHLAVLDLAHEIGADDVERAGLGCQHPGLAEPAKHQRPDAERIAGADEFLVGEPDQRIGAFDLQQRLDELLHEQAFLAARDKMEDHLGVGGRLADGALGDQPVAKRERVGEIAVMGEREAARGEVDEQRLHVAHDRVAAGRIAHMADGRVAFQAVDHLARGEWSPTRPSAARCGNGRRRS